jgi:hypothetical protein
MLVATVFEDAAFDPVATAAAQARDLGLPALGRPCLPAAARNPDLAAGPRWTPSAASSDATPCWSWPATGIAPPLLAPRSARAQRAPRGELVCLPGGHYEPFMAGHARAAEAELAFLRRWARA